MAQEDILVLKDMMGCDKIIFRDKEGKLDPIVCGDLHIVGLFVSGGGILWLVDDTEVGHDIHRDIRPWYFHDKHYALTFPYDIEQILIEKLGN